MLHLDVFIEGVLLTSCQCDGLIVATPTGSTGHSLSAGGPIVEPGVSCLIVNPICPHTLTSRPLLVKAEKELVIKTKPETGTKEICLTIDGQVAVNLDMDEDITVRRSPGNLRLIAAGEKDYFAVLREKLSWGKRGHL